MAVVLHGYAEAAWIQAAVTKLQKNADDRNAWEKAAVKRLASIEIRFDRRLASVEERVDALEKERAIAREQRTNYHLYVHLEQQRAAAKISVEEDNGVATISMIGNVEKEIKKTHAEYFSGKGLRVCISSSTSDNTLIEKGADIMVYAGKGSQHYDVDFEAWSTEYDSLLETRLPGVVVVCADYNPRDTAERFAASPLAKYTRIIVWRRQGPESLAWQKFIRPIVEFVVGQQPPKMIEEFVDKCAKYNKDLCGVIIPKSSAGLITKCICDTELEADTALICDRVPNGE